MYAVADWARAVVVSFGRCSGADAAIKNAEGKTAGEVAAMNEQEALVALLRERAGKGEGKEESTA